MKNFKLPCNFLSLLLNSLVTLQNVCVHDIVMFCFAVYGRRNVAPSVTQYDFAEFIKGGRVDHRLRKRSIEESQEVERRDSGFEGHRGLRTHKTDVLDSIAISYEGTRKILADSEHRGPFYVPHHVTVSKQKCTCKCSFRF